MRLNVKKLFVCLALALGASGCIRTRKAMQRDYARERLAPAAVEDLRRTPAEAARDIFVTVYADPDYRARPGWRARLEDLIVRANGAVGAEFGIRFVLASVHSWDRQASPEDMPGMLAELRRIAPNTGSGWTLGLCGALPYATSNLHLLGMAGYFDRHFLMRGIDDSKEAAEIDEILDRLPAEERLALHRRRWQHKELVVFLHEWAHTFGAPHARDNTSFLYPNYETEQRGFNVGARDLLRQALPIVLEGGVSHELRQLRGAWLARRLLESDPWREWVDADRTQLQELLANLPPLPPTGSNAPATAHAAPPAAAVVAPEPAKSRPAPSVPAAAAPKDEATSEAFTKAYGLASRRKYQDAWVLIEPLLATPGCSEKVHRLACELGTHKVKAAWNDRARDSCRQLATRVPNDPRPLLALAEIHRARGDTKEAVAVGREVHARLLPSGGTAREDWRALAEFFQGLDAVTLAEQAAGRVGGSFQSFISTWAADTRARLALPPRAEALGIPVEDESEYARLMRKGLGRSDGPEADGLDPEWSAFPGSPGQLTLQCLAAERKRAYAQAVPACEKALAKYDGAALAHLALGNALAEEGMLGKAARHLRRTIELLPDVRPAWERLASIYALQNDTLRLQELSRDYRERFNRSLDVPR